MIPVPKCVLASGTEHIFLHKPPALLSSCKTILGRSQPHNETEADRRLVGQLSGGVNENEEDWQTDTRWAAQWSVKRERKKMDLNCRDGIRES